MAAYCIIETEDGWNIVEHPDNLTAEETAHRHGGVVVDPGPFATYEDAQEAITALQLEMDDEVSDAAGEQPLEGRSETGD